jgi:YfiH family protein
MADVPMIRFTDLESIVPGLVAGVTTRSETLGARSVRGGDLDFGLSTGGDLPCLSLRYTGLAALLGFESVAALRQVHGSRIVAVDEPSTVRFRVVGDADGLITGLSGHLLVVTVADCVPVFIVPPDGGTLALLHAGWRGTATGVLQQGIRSVVHRAGCAPGDLRIQLGPAICGSCYEVGPEVTGAFEDPGQVSGHVDLRHVLTGQAIASGVMPESVVASIDCTKCDSERFHSHRGQGDKAGRMAAFLGRMA